MSEILDESMQGLAEEATRNELLSSLADGSAPIQTWAIYLRERLRTVDIDGSIEVPSIFENFLEAAVYCAREKHHEALAVAFEKNLKEERGLNKDNQRVEEEIHAVWRDRFRQKMIGALINKGAKIELFSQIANRETLAYNTLIENFTGQLKKGELFEAAGALCVLERIIKDEYAQVSKGLSKVFPHLDNKDRRYIDDHAEHDEYHYRWIRAALDQILNAMSASERASTMEKIQNGASQIAYAKRSFFESIKPSTSSAPSSSPPVSQ